MKQLPGCKSRHDAYDLQGNITALKRWGVTLPRHYGIVDNLTTTYVGNQLRTLTDNAPQILGEASIDVTDRNDIDTFDSSIGGGISISRKLMTYDANGNLTSDYSRNIIRIIYNELNQPQRVEFDTGHEIFHTLGMDDVEGGAHSGVMKFPPENPTSKDINTIIKSGKIPIIKK